MGLNIVILAAGSGTRMRSSLPKVLHILAGIPLIEHVINTARALNPTAIHVIYGHQGDRVRQACSHLPVNWIEQKQQLGTGHAVMQTLPYLQADDHVLVLYGDVPLISLATLRNLMEATTADGIGIVAAEFADPTGLGRILRDHSGNIIGIVEEKDANEKERQIKEIYSGILTTTTKNLMELLPKLSNQNAQQEYYLPDIIRLAVKSKRSVIGVLARCSREVEGVNDRFQLAELERYYQQQAALLIMSQGASLKDPARFDLRGTLEVGSDVVIDVNVIIEGTVIIGSNSYIGPNTLLRNVKIANDVNIRANSVISDAIIGEHCVVGPFAHIRPGTKLAAHSRVGNFVEVKNAEVGEYSKINHLSYVGDTRMGHHVNVGAGTITCNYDGVSKHQTTIGDYVFIGSNTQIIAPVTIGDGATIGAGTTVCKDAPPQQLTINPLSQTVVTGWVRPEKLPEST